jgi:hypothetical protein
MLSMGWPNNQSNRRMDVLKTRFKLVAMLVVISIPWSAQAKKPKPPKPAADSEASEVVAAPTEIPPPAERSTVAGAPDARTTTTGGWRFLAGFTYMSGESAIGDYYQDRLDMDGSMLPVGLTFASYYEFARGARLGADLGPVSFMRVNSEFESWDVPLALSYGRKFMPKAAVSPYVRGGFKYHIVTGDRVKQSTPGIFAAAGIEFFRTKYFCLGLEAGYDGSEITLSNAGADETFKPGEVLIGLHVIFRDLFRKPATEGPP